MVTPQIFRMTSWFHKEPKRTKGTPGLMTAGFKARKGEHAVMLLLGTLGEGEGITDGWIRERLAERGLAVMPEEAAGPT